MLWYRDCNCEKNCLMPRPLKIAHRGFGAKDNTLLAFRYAVNAKFDVLELDLHQTKDERLIVCHDLFIGPYNVEDTPYDILKMYEPDLITLDVFHITSVLKIYIKKIKKSFGCEQ